jgi:hypothetical protein
VPLSVRPRQSVHAHVTGSKFTGSSQFELKAKSVTSLFRTMDQTRRAKTIRTPCSNCQHGEVCDKDRPLETGRTLSASPNLFRFNLKTNGVLHVNRERFFCPMLVDSKSLLPDPNTSMHLVRDHRAQKSANWSRVFGTSSRVAYFVVFQPLGSAFGCVVQQISRTGPPRGERPADDS